MSRSEVKSTKKMLYDIVRSPVYATLDFDEDGSLLFAAVGLPHNPSFEANYDDQLDEPGEMFLETLYVDPRFRRHQVATRLLSAMAYVAKSNSVEYLHSSVSSPFILKAFKRLFGEDNINLYHDSRAPLPITSDQAALSLERFGVAVDLDRREFDFAFRINLGNVALDGLEKPVIRED